MEWPEGTVLTAVDRSEKMIENVWMGARESAHCAEWRSVPLAAGSQHLSICDGGLSFLEYPAGIRQVAAELHRVLAPGGVSAFRMYVPPAVRESVERVVADLNGRLVENLAHLKLRLWVALQESASEGIRLGDVWAAVRDDHTSAEEFADRVGWPVEMVKGLDLYRGSDEVYRFPSVQDVVGAFCGDGLFELQQVRTPGYALGECCPTVVFRRLAV
jgi:SAM-dependent methyltransferase